MSSRRYRSSYTPRSVRRIRKQSNKQLVVAIVFGVIIIIFFISWGLPSLIGGLSVFNKLKPATLKQISIEDSAIAPPVLNIPYEATNSATIKIAGYASPNSKVEIYVDGEVKSITSANDDGKFESDDIALGIGTNNISGKTVIEESGGEPKRSLYSKNIRLVYSNEKPKLDLSEPNDNTEIKGGDEQSSSSNKKVRVSGRTDSENSVVVNGITVIVDREGNFTTTVLLNDGDNTLTIISANSVGNSTKIERKVIYTP